jgi:hypothetical protein
MEAPTVRKEKRPLSKMELQSVRESLERVIDVELRKVRLSVLPIGRRKTNVSKTNVMDNVQAVQHVGL